MKENCINIGVLFSQSGPMAVSETAHLQGVLLACDEINAGGGVKGQQLNPIILDPEGDDRKYSEMATQLLLQYRVHAIFGCCLSSSRKAVLPIVERFNGILFYPSVYEGFEYSSNVIYGGAVPNQLIIPLIEYIFKHHGRRIALIGSDTLYSREINRVVCEFLSESDGYVVSEHYLPFNLTNTAASNIMGLVLNDEVDTILSTVVGEASITLYSSYAQIETSSTKPPIASLTTTESELAKMEPSVRAGHLAVATYFSTLNSSNNLLFVEAFQKKYGSSVQPSVYSETAYSLVQMFAAALAQCQEFTSDNVLAAISGSVLKAPKGDIFVDIGTNHMSSRPLIGIANERGQYDIVWKSEKIICPDPYLISYTRSLSDGK
ncbi:MAG: hypothetical protein OFPII_01420 [Osedax symbiont Rs1]|nr:MAG: hypothetical protein OFPII_01420 [Osedax symbiont Rs1]